jgi:putative transposase
VLQVQQGGFYPEALEKSQRNERPLTLTIAEMYVQGVSARKVAAVFELLCAPLGQSMYLCFDARYEKVARMARSEMQLS